MTKETSPVVFRWFGKVESRSVLFDTTGRITSTARYEFSAIFIVVRLTRLPQGKIDGLADETDRYRTVNGALACLIEDCGVRGPDLAA